MKTMAEVLAEHQLCAAWEDDAGRAIICTCGADLPTEPLRGEIDMTFLASHQAEVLAAAGYGPVREAAAEALRDAAEYLDRPRALWQGSEGVTVMGYENPAKFLNLTEWLRARAERLAAS